MGGRRSSPLLSVLYPIIVPPRAGHSREPEAQAAGEAVAAPAEKKGSE